MGNLYWTPSQPDCWIAKDDGGRLYAFPTGLGGWRQRRIYRGARRALQAVRGAPHTVRLIAELTGWPVGAA